MAGKWRASTWGEEISLEYGKALRGHDESRGRYRVFGSNGPIGWTSEPLAPGPGVILGRKGAYRGVQYSPDPFFVIDTAYYVVPKSNLDMRWLYYAIRHYKLGELDDGSPIPSTTRAAVYMLDLDVPPLDEQRAIAHILGTLDDKIELNRRMSETLEAMARALFRSWFIDATRDGLPEGWCEISILDFANLLSGGTPRTEVPEYWDGDIPWVSAKDVTKARNSFILDTERKITKAGVENSPSKVLPALTTIVSARGTVGNHCLLGQEMAMNQTNYGLRAKDNRSHYFVFFSVSNLVEELRQQAYGTIFDTITTRTFQHTKIVRPPDVIIQRFESIVGSMMTKVLINLLESETLAALRDALLPKLISGELRVKTADRFVGEEMA